MGANPLPVFRVIPTTSALSFHGSMWAMSAGARGCAIGSTLRLRYNRARSHPVQCAAAADLSWGVDEAEQINALFHRWVRHGKQPFDHQPLGGAMVIFTDCMTSRLYVYVSSSIGRPERK